MKRRDFLRRSGALSGLMLPPSVWGQTHSPSDAEADWLQRSTADGVVWAHDFRYPNEVVAHLGGIGQDRENAVAPRRIEDATSPTGYALEFVALGARLARDFLAAAGPGPRAIEIDNADEWPAGGFYFQLCKPEKDQQNNLFYCNSRSGTSLNVTWIKTSGQPFTPGVQRDWLAGDVAGQHVGKTWTRDFSALTGDSNGIGRDDVNRAGATLRSKVSTNPRYVPKGQSLWDYGWYGRPEYQQKYSTWTPHDGIDRPSPWDGDEFWLQFRVKIDPRFLKFHTYAPPAKTSDGGTRSGCCRPR